MMLLLFVTGCFGSTDEVTTEKENIEAVTESKGQRTSTAAANTVAGLKQKYGSEATSTIAPLYNVDRNQIFTFQFHSDLSQVPTNEIVTVHTDQKVLPESQILTFAWDETQSGKTNVEVKPGTGVLVSSASLNYQDSGWGNAPKYYIRINYDLDAETPTKLDKPLVIPFTIKSDVQVPNLRHEISSDGRLKLKWNAVEGAQEYKIYNASKITLLETTNLPLSGSEEGYAGVFPLLVATVTETEFDDFIGNGKGGLEGAGEFISYQNFGVGGEYYVTAVKDGKESNFSPAVNTTKLSSQLPLQQVEPILVNLYDNLDHVPTSVSVELIDGSTTQRDVIYDTEQIEKAEYGPTNVYYKIKGTAFTGYVRVENVTEADIVALAELQEKQKSNGVIHPDNTIEQPAPDVPTIIGEETPVTEDTNIVELQKEATEKVVEETNQEELPSPTIVEEVVINADSAAEEYLALHFLNAEEAVSLKPFPELQNPDVFFDVFLKVKYQNPLILGVWPVEYDYATATIYVEYEDSKEVIHQKQEAIIEEAKKVLKEIITDGMNDHEKREAIYEYLMDNTSYDNDALASAEANNFSEVDPQYNDSFTTYGILVNKVGVCMSYSYVYQLFSNMVGLESIVVTGDLSGMPHAWNKVKIDEDWLHIDVTNNENTSGIPYLLHYTNDETAKKLGFNLDNDFWLTSEIPMFAGRSNAYDPYVINGLEVTTIEQFSSKLEEMMVQGDDRITLRFTDMPPFEALVDSMGTIIMKVDQSLLDTAAYMISDLHVILMLR